MITGKLSHFRLFDAVIQSIRDEVESRGDSLIQGQAKDWAEYRYLCGQLAGLLLAIDIAEATEKEWRET